MSAPLVENGTWIPLMDYAMKNGVSLSTLRRYIKAGKVQYKTESGKYLIYSTNGNGLDWISGSDSESTGFTEAPRRPDSRTLTLEAELQKAQEEIAELKMLVALYEERLFSNPT